MLIERIVRIGAQQAQHLKCLKAGIISEKWIALRQEVSKQTREVPIVIMHFVAIKIFPLCCSIGDKDRSQVYRRLGVATKGC